MGTSEMDIQPKAKNIIRGNLQNLLKIVGYYFYPRIVDFQKPLLILLGFIIGLFFRNASLVAPTREQMQHLFLVWFTVDFLVYQARYLWNDLRGLREDIAAGKKDRLPVHLMGQREAIIAALIVMILRLFVALILIIIMPEGLRESMFVISLSVFAVAYFYERVSEKNNANGIFVMVSFGYPIRLLAGIMAAWPQFGSVDMCFGEIVVQMYKLVPIFAAFGLLGTYSSILSWTHKAIDQMKRENTVHKGYYKPLIAKIGDRISLDSPLKAQGRLNDHWSMVFNISVILLAMTPCLITLGHKQFLLIAIMEFIFVICTGYFSVASVKKANICAVIVGLVLLAKIALSLVANNLLSFYIFTSILQALFVFLFYYMRFSFTVDYSFAKACKEFVIQLVILILGKRTVDYLENQRISEESLKK